MQMSVPLESQGKSPAHVCVSSIPYFSLFLVREDTDSYYIPMCLCRLSLHPDPRMYHGLIIKTTRS